ncbi:MAG: rhomboid family intramembrane serine protease [Bacillota bacterium]|nr:MAG: rhomboid family intramembrane serine protease [Bacillota bacterium]
MQKPIFIYIKKYIKMNPVTSILLLINTVMVFVVLFMGGFTNAILIELGALVPFLVTDFNEYHRLLFAMFLHGSIIHFLMNGLVLFYLGGFLERYLGYLRYSLIYILSGLASSLAVVYFGPNAITIGASGALYGVVGALFILISLRQNWFPPQAAKSIRSIIVINLILTFVIPSISVEGHLGGLIMGIILIFPLIPKYPYFMMKNPRYKKFTSEDHHTYDA